MKPQAQDLMHHFVSCGLLSDDQLNIIFEEQKSSTKQADQIGHELSFYTKDACLQLKAKFYDLEYIDLAHDAENGLICTDLQKYNNILLTLSSVVYNAENNKLFIAVEDPLDIVLKDSVRDAIHKYFPEINKILFAFGNLDKLAPAYHQQQTAIHVDKNEIISELDALIQKAIDYGASDIHIKPDKNTTCLYFRVHGKLVLHKTWHKKFEARLLSRLKILSGLDIAQSRMPQSGRYSFKCHNRLVDLRVSTHPTIYGEKLAIRILDRYKVRHDLQFLGIDNDNLKILKQCLAQKHGLMLVAGATGSGKTTTLYACLDYLNKSGLNIMTLEDPVESCLNYASQMEISRGVGYIDGIRSILRQDPDVILLGEIRDEDTAKMAFRAAMTGHLVLSTIHSQGLEGIVARLDDLGVKAHMVKEFLLCSMYQELQPKYHKKCYMKGCPECLGTGLIGRSLNFQLKSANL